MGQWQPSERWHDMQSIIVLSSVNFYTFTFSRPHLNTLLRGWGETNLRGFQSYTECGPQSFAGSLNWLTVPKTLRTHGLDCNSHPAYHKEIPLSNTYTFIFFPHFKIICRSLILRMVKVDQGMMGFDALFYLCTWLIANSVLCVRHLILD